MGSIVVVIVATFGFFAFKEYLTLQPPETTITSIKLTTLPEPKVTLTTDKTEYEQEESETIT